MFNRHLAWALWPMALYVFTLVAGCGIGSSSSTTSTAGKTGSVGIMLTDAPADPDLFSEINATIERVELIGGDGGRIALFDGPAETVDLLRLRNESVPFTFSNDVPVGTYCKVRLTLANPDGLELVLAADDSRHFPKLPGNGKLDLLARDCFTVAPGASVTLQLDMDAGNSIHVVQTGSKTTYNFRPVVFVDIINESFTGKLVRVEGVIADVDATAQNLLLCGALPTHQTDGRDCVAVSLGVDSAFFDNVTRNGDAASLDDLLLEGNVGQAAAVVGLVRSLVIDDAAPEIPASELPGSGLCRIWDTAFDAAAQPFLNDVDCNDPAMSLPVGTVLVDGQGHIVIDHRPQLGLEGLAVEMGRFSQVHGIVVTDADANGFTMNAPDTLDVVLQSPVGFNGTRILSKSGQLIDYTAILVRRALKVDGVQQTLSDPLKAAVAIVDTEMDGRVAASGEVGGLITGGFILLPEAGTTPCGVSGDLTILLAPDAAVTTVTITESTVDVSPGGVLASGQEVGVSGQCGADSLSADTVVIVDDQRL
ncbi:MAG: DUF4382 domain-containing protein [Candidatus Thiodiazotropha sp. (ex Monitilora ramsayi)]|nr:DUF4382 domain-containing protein [Candidatus Thiodiazotropha sp. (ex Monitilora ramsayi)]